jgi:hypothetical protein
MKRLLIAVALVFALAAAARAQAAPAPASNLVFTTNGNQVVLSWTASTTAGSGYNVWRCPAACSQAGIAGEILLNPSLVTAVTFTDPFTTPGATYHYVIRAVLSGIASANSNDVSVTIPSAHAVTLAWSASPTPGVGNYNVYQATVTGGPYTRILTGIIGTTATVLNVVSGTTYFYVITAVCTSTGCTGESAFSNEASATIPAGTIAAAAAPAGATATPR